jgi:GT2 family glycosyltransferase
MGRYVLLLNTDAFISSDTLRKTVSFMDAHPQCGVLGVKLVSGDGTLLRSFWSFPTPWNVWGAANAGWVQRVFLPGKHRRENISWDYTSALECDWVPGCYYLTRREVIQQVGLFDPRFFLYYEEIDHCRAVRGAGWSVIYYPFTQVVHLVGESARSEAPLDSNRQLAGPLSESELLYFRKHYGILGVLLAVAVTGLNNAITVGMGLFWFRNMARAAVAARHSWKMLKVLAATGLGAHSTR